MNALKKNASLLFKFAKIQAMCCIFPLAVFSILAITSVIHIPYIPRYDLIFILLLLVQILMVKLKLETTEELKIICLFHILGLLLEIFKVNISHSWAYPEASYLKIFNVPFYSGFMYASVGSYVVQAWKKLKLNVEHWPSLGLSFTLSFVLYLNFFTNYFIYDFRYFIILAIIVVFWRAQFIFSIDESTTHKMKALLSFSLIGFFIYIAENIASFFNAYRYPNQAEAWHLVGFGKMSSWFLLVIVSIVLVVNLKQVKGRKQ
jgi:uncharacterized membrane protein YoaT (DUF817 family)